MNLQSKAPSYKAHSNKTEIPSPSTIGNPTQIQHKILPLKLQQYKLVSLKKLIHYLHPKALPLSLSAKMC